MLYFVSDGEFIKIGRSGDPKQRRLDLRCGNPRPLKLLDKIPRADHTETLLHHILADYRAEGEWFDLDEAGAKILACMVRPLGGSYSQKDAFTSLVSSSWGVYERFRDLPAPDLDLCTHPGGVAMRSSSRGVWGTSDDIKFVHGRACGAQIRSGQYSTLSAYYEALPCAKNAWAVLLDAMSAECFSEGRGGGGRRPYFGHVPYSPLATAFLPPTKGHQFPLPDSDAAYDDLVARAQWFSTWAADHLIEWERNNRVTYMIGTPRLYPGVPVVDRELICT